MQTDLIIINDYCRICHIEPSFIYQLEQDGLIEIRTINGVKYFDAIEYLAELHNFHVTPWRLICKKEIQKKENSRPNR